MRSIRIFVVSILALGLIYALALLLSMFNEYFDKSQPSFEMATVVEKHTRFNPFPISVLELQLADGTQHQIDVLDELAQRVDVGTKLIVAKSKGFFSKTWLQDKEFYDELNGSTRILQGFPYIINAFFLSICWYIIAKIIFASSNKRALFSLVCAYLIAFGLFWFLL